MALTNFEYNNIKKIAQVCPNGHISNLMKGNIQTNVDNYCEKCGEKTFNHCPHCKNPIRYRKPPLPAYCFSCGSPFPWTEKRIATAIELSVEDNQLNEEELKQFKESINEIAKDTPAVPLAAKRFLKLIAKLSKRTEEAVYKIIVDLASETTKKILIDKTF